MTLGRADAARDAGPVRHLLHGPRRAAGTAGRRTAAGETASAAGRSCRWRRGPRPHVRPTTRRLSQDDGHVLPAGRLRRPGLARRPRGTVKQLRVVGLEYRAAAIGNLSAGGPRRPIRSDHAGGRRQRLVGREGRAGHGARLRGRLGHVPGPGPHAALLPGPGRTRLRRADHAQLGHADARRDAVVRRLPRAQEQRAPRPPQACPWRCGPARRDWPRSTARRAGSALPARSSRSWTGMRPLPYRRGRQAAEPDGRGGLGRDHQAAVLPVLLDAHAHRARTAATGTTTWSTGSTACPSRNAAAVLAARPPAS